MAARWLACLVVLALFGLPLEAAGATFLTPRSALAIQEPPTPPATDPLGRPRNPAQQPPRGATTNPPPDQSKSGEKRDLPGSPLESTRGKSGPPGLGSLRDFQPQRADGARLPTTRDFAAETQSTREQQLQIRGGGEGDATAGQAPQPADNILTQAASGALIPAPHGGFQMVRRSVKFWEFGLEVTAVGGPMAGVVASAPIPIAWPEQRIQVLTEFASPTVGNVRMKPFPGQGQQMIVSIPHLPAGQTARATVTMRLERFDIVANQQRPDLQIPKRNSKEGRLYLGDSPYIETSHRRIRELAATIGSPEQSPWEQVEEIYRWVQQNIEYEFDPTIHSCLQALDSGKGDCEEMASLFVALCRAKGIPARAVWCNDHTYPEFLLVTPEGQEIWFPCQITTHDHIFGEMFDDRPILQKGDKFQILGEPRPYRYLKAALTAKSAAGSPQFKWIIQEVDSADLSADHSPLGR